MKILQVNNYYAERSTGKLTADLHRGILASGNESLVAYGRGGAAKESGVTRLCPEWYAKVCSVLVRLTGIPHGCCTLSTWKLFRLILREKPDIVHLQCINEHFVNIYRLMEWLKRHRIKTVLSLHAEFMYTANCGYAFDCNKWMHGCSNCEQLYHATKSCFFDRTGTSWRKMYRAMAGFERDCVVTAVSPWTRMRAQQADILKGFEIRTVLNGVNTRVIHRVDDISALRSTLKLPSGKVIVNVTHYFTMDPDNIKGGRYIAELAKRMPEVTFLVIGRCERSSDLPDNLHLMGFVSDQKKMAEYYSAADLTLMVSKKETFSMPCAESLCCGTPVVGFKAGAPEQISLPEYSEFIDHGDLDGLEALVRTWLAKDLDRTQIAQNAGKAYSVETMVNSFLEVYERCLRSSKE